MNGVMTPEERAEVNVWVSRAIRADPECELVADARLHDLLRERAEETRRMIGCDLVVHEDQLLFRRRLVKKEASL